VIKEIEVVPEGEGFEIDYDKYGKDGDSYYKDADEWWGNFSKLGADELEQSELKDSLLKELNGDKCLAMVVNHFIGENYKTWLDKKGIDTLGGFTPRQCLSSDYGMKRLRMLLFMAH